MEYTLAVLVLIWMNCLHVCDCNLAVSNEDGTTKTTKYVCKGESTIDFIWTYDDADSDKDFIAEIKWSREISGGTAELIMTYATGAGTTDVETAWNGRVTRVTSATNSIGMQLSNPHNDDEAEYYVTLFVDKPTTSDDYTVTYKDQSITLVVVIGPDDTQPIPSLTLTYNSGYESIMCTGITTSLGETTLAILYPDKSAAVQATGSATYVGITLASSRPGGEYECVNFYSSVSITPQGLCYATQDPTNSFATLSNPVTIPPTVPPTVPPTTVLAAEVDSVWPVFGPQSGGTNITVRGQHLPMHGQLTVYVGPLECTTIYVNTTIIIARTLGLEEDESHLLDQRLPIYITIDNSKNVTSNAVFTFKRDPTVDSVYPKESIVPGGTFITANGSNFNSVAVIIMETTMVLKTRTNKGNNETSTVYITDCEVLNDNQFKCPTAFITLPDVFINKGIETKRKRDVSQLESSVAADISSRHSRSKRQENLQWVTPNGDSTLEFYIGFRLDGVDDYKNFTSITIYAEPLFLESGLKKMFEKGKRVPFKGEHLDRGVTVYDYSITIGKRTCIDIELLSNSLSCIPPQTKPVNKTVNGEEIIIHIGLNVDHLAGHLIYSDEQWPLYVWILIGVLSALVIIAIVVTIIVCVKKRKKSTQ